MSFGTQFLTRPEFFPERLSGENCGSERWSIDLFGGPYHFDGLRPEWIPILHEKLTNGEPPKTFETGSSVQTTLFQATSEDFLERDVRAWEYSLEFDYRPWGIGIAGLSWMARLELSPKLRGAIWTSFESFEDVYGVIENYLRILTAYRCLDLGGMLVHSTSIVIENEAWLFFGRSGAGKSTLSRLALDNQLEVLSDDLNVLVPTSEGPDSAPSRWEVSVVPFTGDLEPSPRLGETIPLRSVNRLEKSDPHRLSAASTAETLASLTAVCPYVNLDPYRQPELWHNLIRLADVEKHVLFFAPRADVFELCESSLARNHG